MAFSFDKLSPEAKRAAFAHMGARAKVANAAKKAGRRKHRLGSGDRHKAFPKKKLGPAPRHQQLAAKRMPTEAQDKQKAFERLSPGYLSGHTTANDVEVLQARYRLMHGRNPSPREDARLRRRIGKTRKMS